MKCTWRGCTNKGRRKKRDIGGNQFAILCDKHDKEFDAAMAGDNRVAKFKAFVVAQGFDETPARAAASSEFVETAGAAPGSPNGMAGGPAGV